LDILLGSKDNGLTMDMGFEQVTLYNQLVRAEEVEDLLGKTSAFSTVATKVEAKILVRHLTVTKMKIKSKIVDRTSSKEGEWSGLMRRM
jgi:hypothetical protein